MWLVFRSLLRHPNDRVAVRLPIAPQRRKPVRLGLRQPQQIFAAAVAFGRVDTLPGGRVARIGKGNTALSPSTTSKLLPQ